MKEELFHLENQNTWEDLGKGVKRQVAVFNSMMMLTKVKFEKGAKGELHQHPHIQISYVKSGKFLYIIDDVVQTLEEGDSCIIPANSVHGCECISAGELIDSFTPCREDFLKEEAS
ncbi:cupin domain-containing protein [Sphingobacterium sp. SRCM116780]|uniref:cupin domain-containing protein n=1 Tax=Sphingobacterium sp. SRCM116780 TaxID=2907623 RepID=UPI001F46620D|nr:cupin domain-containing protein [Sphingobacterium sp. SRCM116780]UIR57266.1 cupin domain-containing protein [Sphingobacterium sp. SRCM116780]